MQPLQPQQLQQLDPTILNLTKAIRKAEGFNGDPNIRGKAGEWGAYQFMPETWDRYAKELGVNAKWGQASLAQQNEVAYKKFKQWKDAGYNVGQIASMWNAGEGRPNAYAEGWRKVDPKTGEVIFDTPAYAQKVAQEYQRLKNGGQAAPIGNTQTVTSVPRETPEQMGILSQLGTGTVQPPQEPSKLDNRLSQGSEALGKLSTGVAEGDISQIASGAIQTGGALAGGALDAVDAGLNAATFGGYNAAMDFIGKKVIAPVFSSAGGGKVMEQWQQFATENPEAAKNIGAIGNIASAIPVFKVLRQGLGFAKDAATSAVATTGFTKTAEEAAKQELKTAAQTTIKGKRVITAKDVKGKEIDPVDTIVDKDYLPDVVEDANGIPRYSTQGAMDKIQSNLDANDNLLDQRLQAAMSTTLAAPVISRGRTMAQDATRAGYYPVADMRNDMAKVIKEQFKAEGKVNDALRKMNSIIDDYAGSYGDLIPLTLLREIKSGVRAGVKYGSDADQALDKEVRKQMGRLYMEKIEEMAKERGFKDVADISGQMKQDLDAIEVLKYLDNRSVVERPGFRSMLGRKSGDAATIAGEAIGQATLGPGIGAFAGRAISNRAISGSGKSVVGKLKTKRGRKRPSAALVGAALVPSLLSSTQEGLQEEQR